MTRTLPDYHQRMAEANRTAIVDAARSLFLAGYDRTSLARVAEAAGVSKATLFKQFPTKGALFEAVILAVGRSPEREIPIPSIEDPRVGLLTLGKEYASLLTHPSTADLIRLVITDGHRFPELRERTFDFGTLPALRALGEFLRLANEAGSLRITDRDVASTQFLGMIASAIFWPRLVHPGWSIDAPQTDRVITEAVETILARYEG